jgi:endo-1,4-beta-D-glucanase Y
VRYQKGKGWQLKADKPIIGSYDAIRVYLWTGMLDDGDKQKAPCWRALNRWRPRRLHRACRRKNQHRDR